ncbi:MAG TPA: NRDE family protein [Candidatus Dormibacteraeota bacterium]
MLGFTSMCTILVAWRCVPGAPLLIAANRDELLDRPTAPAGVLLEGPPRVAGGRDLAAGGTWMAVAADGRVTAVTNRHVGERDPSRRSRGELPLALLAAADPVACLDALDAAAYNPANVLLAAPDVLVVRHLVADGDGPLWLGPGPHVLTTVDVDDSENPKAQRLGKLLRTAVEAVPDASTALRRMEALLADHGPDGDRGPDAACVHLERYGTRSSTSALVDDGGSVTYRVAEGTPCTTPFEDAGGLLAPGGRRSAAGG